MRKVIPFLLGEEVGGYHLCGELGHGGQGVVYACERGGVRYALKAPQSPEGGLFSASGSGESYCPEWFAREIEFLESAIGHRNIVRFEASGHESVVRLGYRVQWYVMEYLRGEPLERILVDLQGETLFRRFKICEELVHGVQCIHERGYVYRDMKPGNVNVYLGRSISEDEVKIYDFGLLVRVGEVGSGDFKGTVPYMSPEQIDSNACVDCASDVWSLGVLFVELLSGRHPFWDRGVELHDVESRILRGELSILEELCCPEELRSVVRGCLCRERSDRYRDANALSVAFQGIRSAYACRMSALGEGLYESGAYGQALLKYSEAAQICGRELEYRNKLKECWGHQLGYGARELHIRELGSGRAMRLVGRCEFSTWLCEDSCTYGVYVDAESYKGGAVLMLGEEGFVSEGGIVVEVRSRAPVSSVSDKSECPSEWPLELWRRCWRGDYLDFSQESWCGLSHEDQVKYSRAYQRWYGDQQGLSVERVFRFGASGLEFRVMLIPPGRFWMGSPADERERDSDEQRHLVLISKVFWLGKYPLTQGQWQAVMGHNPASFKESGLEAPVECVSWDDVQAFCERVNVSNSEVRWLLPSEAQWEYACRSGTTSVFNLGNNITPEEVNYDGDCPYAGGAKGVYRGRTVAVGSLANGNAWGLYDMHGNVWEWCADWYGAYPSGEQVDPIGPSTGAYRVERGGSWFFDACDCRCAFRGSGGPARRVSYLGVRLAVVQQ